MWLLIACLFATSVLSCKVGEFTLPPVTVRTADATGQNYTLNLCSATPCAHLGADVAVCQQDNLEEYFSAGSRSSMKLVRMSTHLHLTFEGGSRCHNGAVRKTTVRIFCDAHVHGFAVDHLREDQVCHYEVAGRSNVACANAPCEYDDDGTGSCSVEHLRLPDLGADCPFRATDKEGQNYSFSFCQHVSCGAKRDAHSDTHPVAVCQVDSAGVPLSAGSKNSAEVMDANEISINFGNGAQCGASKRETNVVVTCDAKVFGLQVDTVEEGPRCTYGIYARSDSACMAGPQPCKYAVDGATYDLSHEQPFELRTPTNRRYKVSLCSANVASSVDSAGGSFVSQFAPEAKKTMLFSQISSGTSFSLGRTISRTAATRHVALRWLFFS